MDFEHNEFKNNHAFNNYQNHEDKNSDASDFGLILLIYFILNISLFLKNKFEHLETL